MKKALMFATFAALLLVMAVGASAGTVERLRVNVPFDFYVDKELMPAGEYFFEMRPISSYAATSSSVYILDPDRIVIAMVLTSPGSDAKGDDHLHFAKYGKQYFLSKVECLGLQANLRRSKAERELLARVGKAQTTIVAAQ